MNKIQQCNEYVSQNKDNGLQIIICCIPCNFYSLFVSGIYRYVFVSRNCLGRELCRCCYQLLLHCFVKYSAGVLFAVKVWRLCKCIKLYFFACQQRIEFCTREKFFLFGYDIHDCTMHVWPGYHVIQTLIVLTIIFIKYMTLFETLKFVLSFRWHFCQHCYPHLNQYAVIR